ncbi:MAG: glycosyltransferase [Saprospiraceae bacterium]
MYNSFLSVVTVLQSSVDVRILPAYLANIYPILKQNFADFEIILVNNHVNADFHQAIDALADDLKHNIFLLNLSTETERNHAILAGLDRANGDYTLIFELGFHEQPHLILDLYQQTQAGFDIVYLRARERPIRLHYRPLYRLFYFILKKYSALKVDEKAYDTRIISRRALNSLLRLRENLRYMKAIYSMVGYSTSYIEVKTPPSFVPIEDFSERFRTSLVAITSYTTFLRTLLLWIFIFSFIFLVGVIVNALKVKFTGIDLFGSQQQAISGWTFLVILISIFFAVTCLNLYIMSIYLSNIYNEIKQRPLYIIESIKRF